MWGAPDEPPDDTEVAGSSDALSDLPVSSREVCEDTKSQLETFKDIMLKNKHELKKKEEELQEYASKLSQIKSRTKRSRFSRDAGSSSVETTPKSKGEDSVPGADDDSVDDISQARTPKAKSSLLRRKLAENRKIFERRSKEMTESKRAVEEKVEAIRQQMDQTDLTLAESQRESLVVTPVRPVLIAPQVVSPIDVQIGLFQDKDNKIAELSNRILELEATIIDLQDNLREKDSVIDSKMKAVTLMSADLSKRGKSTLDTLEDTKDEMRTMQENFVLIETSLRSKNENLLQQLEEQNNRVAEFEATISRYEQAMEEKRLTETASANLSRTTMDTLADTKDEMRSMQENFILIETSLREKNDHLLQQLQERETKLAEAEEKIYKFESGAGVLPAPEIPDLQYKIDRLDHSNRVLQDEKYELQKNLTELQEKIVSRESSNGNGLIVEKDNRIAELENLIEELKNSNQLLEEESKAELQKQVEELAAKNDELRSKVDALERLTNDLETEKNELRGKIPDESTSEKEDAVVNKLKKELDDLNKSTIKLKAQHKSKLRNLQKQLESFKSVSDANAELVKLGNQVALLEEEKGNLQLSLVDFDELKASTGDWQDRIADLENRVSSQANDIQAHVEAIAILENQKLDLMQDLHTAKQEISALEAENAESENLRVSAEMKIVDMEEQLESLNREQSEKGIAELSTKDSSEDFVEKMENLTRENMELVQRIAKLEEKSSSEAGSTESFETIHEDRNELLKRLEALSARNTELEERLLKMEEATRSNVGSTESFETINDIDKSELVKKIELLSRENSDLVGRLNKIEEKGSSDSGSTESFEKIPEQVDQGSSRLEMLTRENNELVIKLTKLEEKMDALTARQSEEMIVLSSSEDVSKNDEKVNNLIRENNDLTIKLTKVEEELSRVFEEKQEQERLAMGAESRLNTLNSENQDLVIKLVKLEEKNAELKSNLEKWRTSEPSSDRDNVDSSSSAEITRSLEIEIETCRKLIAEQAELLEDARRQLADKETELETSIERVKEYEATGMSAENLERELKESSGFIEEWKTKCESMEQKMEILESGKMAIEDALRSLQEENEKLMVANEEKNSTMNALKKELDETILNFANRLDEERAIAVKQEQEISSLRELLRSKDQELHEKYTVLQNEMINIDSLQDELNERRAQLKDNERMIFSLNEEIQSLKAETIVSKEQVAEAKAEIVLLRDELSTKAGKEAKNQELVDEMNKKINIQTKENVDLRAKMGNSSAEIEHLRALLTGKDNEIAALLREKTSLEERISDSTIAKDTSEAKLVSLQNNLADSVKFNEDLKSELNNAYKMLELLKIKHGEDIELQNQRLQDLVEELSRKTSECEILQAELAQTTKLVENLKAKNSELETCREQLIEKEILVGQSVPENVKIDLESRIKELEQKLLESDANTQTQLQKRKILAANLKKKSAQCEELEAKIKEAVTRASEFEIKASELEARIAELEPRAAEFERKSMELGAKVGELEAEIIELESKAATFEQKATELGIKAAEYEAEAKDCRIKMAEIEERIKDSEAKAMEFEAKAYKYESEVGEAEAKAARLEAQVEELEPKAASLEFKVAELEVRATELEEKWIWEKSEKDALNLKIQEDERTIRDKSESIFQLEQQLKSAQSEAALSSDRAETLSRELNNATENIAALASQVKEMFNEMEALRSEIEARSAELENERTMREALIKEYESKRENKVEEEAKNQQTLEEAKEKARELGVRMQVMESEYVEQLNTIQTLKTENGMLLSKQAQINERLENAEKEASERKILLDQMQRETTQLENTETGSDDEQSRNDDKQSCDHCDQRQTVVQALEAKLQERDAEIENLDNELANSIGNFVHMRESLRVSDLMGQSTSRSRNHEESRESNELVLQYNSLMARNAELNDELSSKTQENQELNEKIATLEALNAALRERTGAAADELVDIGEATTSTSRLSNNQLRETLQARESELHEARNELEIIKQHHEEWINGTRSKIQELESYNSELSRACDDLTRSRNQAETEVLSLKEESARCQEKIQELQAEVDKYRNADERPAAVDFNNEEPRAASSLFSDVKDDSPKLFDAAKLFGPTISSDSNEHRELIELRSVLAHKDLEIVGLSQELKRLNDRIVHLESHNQELKIRNEQENSEAAVERLSFENAELLEKMRTLQIDNAAALKIIDLVCSILKNLFEDFGDEQMEALSYLEIHSPTIHSRLVEMNNYLQFERNERNELVSLLDNYKQRVSRMEEELRSSNDPARIQELEERVDKIIRERDIKQLQVNDLARSLEEMQESLEKAASNEETRLRNLQASLDRALSENDRLKTQLEVLSRETETTRLPEAETSEVREALEEDKTAEWKVGEVEESRGVQSSDMEVPLVAESSWDDETKLDDEIWQWNPEDAQLDERHSLVVKDPLLPTLERRLNAKIAELEDTIRDLQMEKEKLGEEVKSTQVRSGKLVKKLKEFKIQNESLQQQLKIQKASVDFGDLDTAIEEELKSQINGLEKALTEAKEETRKISLERDNLSKRIEVLASANERLVEMKERQDMEVEVLQIRIKELSNKLESMDRKLQKDQTGDEMGEETPSIGEPSIEEATKVKQVESLQSEATATKKPDCLCDKYKSEIEELRDELEALAAENEQLQKLLEEQKATRLSTESKLNDRLSETAKEVELLSLRNNDIQKELDDTRNNYESLIENCDRSRKNWEQENIERETIFETKITEMREEMNSANSEINKLRENVRALTVEKEELVERTKSQEETTERLANLSESMTELTELLNARVQEVAELKREVQRLKADKSEALETVEDLAQNCTRELSIKNEEAQRYALECESRLKEQNLEIIDLREKLSVADLERSACRVDAESTHREIERLNNALVESRFHRESLQSELATKDRELSRNEDEMKKYIAEIERLNETIRHLQKLSADTIDEANKRIREIEDRETILKNTINELTIRESETAEQFNRRIIEKDNQLASFRQMVVNLEDKINHLTTMESTVQSSSSMETKSDEISHSKRVVDDLRDELSRRNEEIENYRYQLSESTYPSIIQALQDQVNKLYEEKVMIEESLESALKESSKEREWRETLKPEVAGIGGSEDEIVALKKEIDERDSRLRALNERYENVEIEINELRLHLATKEEEIAMLQQRFDSTRQESELLRNALKGDLPRRDIKDIETGEGSSTSPTPGERSSNELDLALYMLHQRDVRCEELTHELMQLLEERDTLQLRLSNAIRVNEELRKSLPIEAQASEDNRETSEAEPRVEQPSPSKSVGPVEIAKEAMDTPNEEKIALAQKLSQLHNMGHRRDVRLMDDRELRHNQQMSLLAHRDVLSTLPPEAAARLVNANYTLSRDVQSQSSILMNWLWGKSTPKVVHM